MSQIDQERLQLEKERLQIDKERAKRESAFWNRHFGQILSAAVSIAAIGVTAISIIMTNSQKDRELRAADLEWKLKVAELFIANDDKIFTPNQQKKTRLVRILIATVPDDILRSVVPELSAAVVSSAEDLSTVISSIENRNIPREQKGEIIQALQQAQTGSADAQASSARLPAIYVHYKDAKDSDDVDSVIEGLRRRGYSIRAKRLVVEPTSGDIRYYKPEDRAAAEALRGELNSALGGKLKIEESSLLDLSKRFPNLPSGVMELWIPALGSRAS